MSLDGIKSFVAVSDTLATSGQPTEAELREVAAVGFETVMNLGLLDPRYCLPDEAGLVGSLGLRYVHIPVDFKAPSLRDFAQFETAMAEAAGQRLLVHCAANMRVSCFVALLGEKELGWTREQADAHVARVWQPDPTWAAFMAEVRRTF